MSVTQAVARRAIWGLFLAGPIIWFGHFMIVYLMGETWCSADDSAEEILGLPVLSFVTVVVTVVAAGVTLVFAEIAHRRWRARADNRSDWLDGDDRNAGLALAGALMGMLFAFAILFVGLPAAFLVPC